MESIIESLEWKLRWASPAPYNPLISFEFLFENGKFNEINELLAWLGPKGTLREEKTKRNWKLSWVFDRDVFPAAALSEIVFFFLARRAWARLFSLRLLVACLWVGYGWGPGPKATSPKRRQAQPVNQRNEKKTAIEVKWTNQINLSGSLFHGMINGMKRESELIWICEWSPTQAPKSARQAEMESNQTHFIVCVWWMEWKGWVGSSLGG